MDDVSCPKELLDIQRWFAKIITVPYQETDNAKLPIYPSSLIDEIRVQIPSSKNLKSEERIGIYHQQYWWRLLSVMQELYPSLVHIFDYKNFNNLLAEPYLFDCPPEVWFMSHIGLGLPEWLKNNYKEKNVCLVLELSYLDLAYESLIFKEILPKIELDNLHLCESEVLYLQSFVLLFELNADFFSFREQLLLQTPEYWQTSDLPPIDTNPNVKRYFVLYRKDEKNFYEELSEAKFALLSCFQKGAKLEELIDQIADWDDVFEWFKIISSRGWLTFSKN